MNVYLILIIVVFLVMLFYKKLSPNVPFAFKNASLEQKHSIRLFMYFLNDFDESRKSIIQQYAQLFGFDVSIDKSKRETMISNLSSLTTIQKTFLGILALETLKVNGAKEQETLFTHNYLKEIGVPVEVLQYLEISINIK